MLNLVFAVSDIKAGAFMAPFSAASAGLAVRMFQDAVANRDSVFHRHPDDFVLFQIGTFDDLTGELVATSPVNLGYARSYMPAPTNLSLPFAEDK